MQAEQYKKILDSLNLSLESLTPVQLEGLEDLIKKVKDPRNITPRQAKHLVNTLGIDLEKLQKKVKGVPKQSVRIGANEKCPCGSGKKYKFCCRSG